MMFQLNDFDRCIIEKINECLDPESTQCFVQVSQQYKRYLWTWTLTQNFLALTQGIPCPIRCTFKLSNELQVSFRFIQNVVHIQATNYNQFVKTFLKNVCFSSLSSVFTDLLVLSYHHPCLTYLWLQVSLEKDSMIYFVESEMFEKFPDTLVSKLSRLVKPNVSFDLLRMIMQHQGSWFFICEHFFAQLKVHRRLKHIRHYKVESNRSRLNDQIFCKENHPFSKWFPVV